ncbi:MAG: TAT-variant-translocated molybdopterin oxidoreductase [Acidobacteriales bacterium]|nr:TAT-variant-translocated molybdopterin oxidoreductase [Terriglobales bacterium]
MATDPISKLVQIQTAKSAPAPAVAPADVSLDLETVRERLAQAKGPRYWRSLEELTDEPGFDAMMEREFPRYVSEWTDPVSRRGFLKLMSASLALAGLSACTKQPDEPIVPYVQQPEDLIPGKPMFYATARPSDFGAQPLLVKSHMFRPVKVDGNPEHPYSQGASDVISQASLLDLYDPDRAQSAIYNGGLASRKTQLPGERPWGEFLNDVRDAAATEKTKQGAGLRFLTETITSPSLGAMFKDVLKAFPQAKLYQYDPVNRDAARAGARIAFGQYVEAQYKLDQADVIVSLDADFLSGSNFPGFLQLARDFAKRRKLEGVDPKDATMSRLYVVESQTTTTGGKADHRLAMRASDVEAFAAALAGTVGAGGGGTLSDPKAKAVLDTMVKDLLAAKGKCVVVPGEQQSANVHALAAAINQALGNVGKTIVYTDPVEIFPSEQVAGLKELVADMNAGKVTMLVMVGGDPAYDAPADFKFGEAMMKVPFKAALSTHRNETAQLCHWHVPMAHYLEAWGDARAYDGSVCIQQPLIDPLYQGKTAYELLAAFTESPGVTPYDLLRTYWQGQTKAGEFESWWRKTLHDGFVPDSAAAAKNVTAKAVSVTPAKSAEMEIVFRPDANVFDGRYNNNGWLQELPRPITKLTWDNAVQMSMATYHSLGLKDWRPKFSPLLEVTVDGRTVKGPDMIVPGHPDNSVTVHLGFGRSVVGRVGTGTGFNAYTLRTSANPNVASVRLKVTGVTQSLASTHHQFLIESKPAGFIDQGEVGETETGVAAESRELIKSSTLDEYKKNPHFTEETLFYMGKIKSDGKPMTKEEAEEAEKNLTLFAENGHASWTTDPTKLPTPYDHQWGMTIDMNSCVGCNACIAACVSENNIAVVGKEQVILGRAMHWIRIDTYFESPGGDHANPRAFFQPLPCMQCENAPCEPVCPVGATVHSPEGLNNMVYNRCVGTRYCSNNCPYKVRHFNFLLFSDFETESLKPMRNPDVSVRSRGVMEKCTYCVQRINAARIVAEKEDRTIRDGEIVTACQQSCPTGAIVFGNISDPESKVSKLKKHERNYALLAEVNTRPRTTYLAAVHNPNPGLGPKSAESEHHAG